MDGPAVIFIDNVHGRLESRQLAKVLTLTVWSDSILGLSKTVELPNRATWVATGNNITTNLEIARRSLRLRLDAGIERPWLRAPTEFAHPDFLAWVRTERAHLVWAALTLIESWRAAGRPPGVGTLGKFEEYVRVVGGILAHACIPGFLGNLETVYEVVDEESDDTRRFLRAWWAELKDTPALVSRLYTIATGQDVNFPVSGKDDVARHVSLGRRLRKLLGRPYEIDKGLTVAVARGDKTDAKARAGLWRLEEVRSRDTRGPRDVPSRSGSEFGVAALQKQQPAPANDSDNLSNLSYPSTRGEAPWRCPCGTINRAADPACEFCGQPPPAGGGETGA